MIRKNKGIAIPAIIAVISIIIIVGGTFYFNKPQKADAPEIEETVGEVTANAQPVKDPRVTDSSVKKYSGIVLAGIEAPMLDFTKADYDKALEEKKVIALYFYAKWCPLCRAEIPKAYEAFDELTSSDVIGFRVNYKDDDTDKDEEALARQFGVPYQHTKVILKNGIQVGKFPDSWEKDRYLSEINKVLK